MKKISIIWKFPKEEFETIVKSSTSFSTILTILGLNNIGGNIKTVKRRCYYENIDFSHISIGINSNKGRKFPYKSNVSDKEVFCKNSVKSRTLLKRRYKKISEYVCSICGLNNIWNKKDLVLVIDHINGIRDDNRIENLRWLCPNCNSQTDTFCGRNNKK